MDRFAALRVATEGFSSVLATVGSSDWALDSPNPGWTVHDLVNHVVGGNFRYLTLLTGAPVEAVEALRNVEHLGVDPLADFDSSSADLLEAFADPLVLDRVTHHRLGDRTGNDLLTMRVLEHSLHGWDLAVSIGAGNPIDSEAAEAALAYIDGDPSFLSRSAYVPLQGAAEEPDPVRRLLLISGRTPR